VTHNHLFLALSTKGWGEAILGRTIATALQTKGDVVDFVCNQSMETLFAGGEFRYETITDNLGPLLRVLIEECLSRRKYSSIFLSDFTTCEQVCRRLGVDARFLLDYGSPVIAMDTWHHELTGSDVDLFYDRTRTIHNWFEGLHRIIPVPFAPVSNLGNFYRHIPSSVVQPRKVAQHVKDALNLSDKDKLIVISTAEWQQSSYNNPDGDRISEKTSILLTKYLSQISHTNLLHVGPRPFAVASDFKDKYHWRPQMPKKQFDTLLGSCDLYLSLNLSATTTTTTVASKIPTIVVQNSYYGITTSQIVEQLNESPSQFVREWLDSAVPLYRFRLWPLGLYKFFDPILRNNPYCSTFELVELLDESNFISTVSQVLWSQYSRERMQKNCSEYWQAINDLPSGDVLVSKIIEAHVR